MAPPPGTRRSKSLWDPADNHRRSEDDREVRLRELHQMQIEKKTLHSEHDFPCYWATTACALGNMRSPGNSHWRRSICAALHRRRHEAYGWVYIEVQVGSPREIQRMEGSWRREVGQASEAISYRSRRLVYLQEIHRIPKIGRDLKGNEMALHSSVEWSHWTGEPHDHGARMMLTAQCRTFEQALSLLSLSGGLTQEPHSDAITSPQDSAQGPEWEEAIFEASPCVRMLWFRPRSERETKEAELPSHSRFIHWVQHIN